MKDLAVLRIRQQAAWPSHPVPRRREQAETFRSECGANSSVRDDAVRCHSLANSEQVGSQESVASLSLPFYASSSSSPYPTLRGEVRGRGSDCCCWCDPGLQNGWCLAGTEPEETSGCRVFDKVKVESCGRSTCSESDFSHFLRRRSGSTKPSLSELCCSLCISFYISHLHSFFFFSIHGKKRKQETHNLSGEGKKGGRSCGFVGIKLWIRLKRQWLRRGVIETDKQSGRRRDAPAHLKQLGALSPPPLLKPATPPRTTSSVISCETRRGSREAVSYCGSWNQWINGAENNCWKVTNRMALIYFLMLAGVEVCCYKP